MDGGDVLYVERVRAGLTRLGVDIRIGTQIRASVGIIGHAILAFLLYARSRAGVGDAAATRRDGAACADEGRTRPNAGSDPPARLRAGHGPCSATVCACSPFRCSTPTAIRSPRSASRRRSCACRWMNSSKLAADAPATRRARDRPRRAGERHHLDGLEHELPKNSVKRFSEKTMPKQERRAEQWL